MSASGKLANPNTYFSNLSTTPPFVPYSQGKPILLSTAGGVYAAGQSLGGLNAFYFPWDTSNLGNIRLESVSLNFLAQAQTQTFKVSVFNGYPSTGTYVDGACTFAAADNKGLVGTFALASPLSNMGGSWYSTGSLSYPIVGYPSLDGNNVPVIYFWFLVTCDGVITAPASNNDAMLMAYFTTI